MNYTVDYFIKKFEAIPESLWCAHSLLNDKGQSCALGHCRDKGEGMELVNFICVAGHSVVDINNGFNYQYPQPTPKQRVLAALYDIKAKEIQITEVHEVLEHQTVNL